MECIVNVIKKNLNEEMQNQNCIHLELDYDNPIISGNNITYPILNMYFEKNDIDSIDELKIKMPVIPDLTDFVFVNIVCIKNEYRILALRDPIRILNEKVSIINYINDVKYILKDNKWDKKVNDISFKSTIEKEDIIIIYSNYNIYDNQNNIYFKKNKLDDFYNYVLTH